MEAASMSRTFVKRGCYWLDFVDATGARKRIPTGLLTDDEGAHKDAEAMLAKIEAGVAAKKRAAGGGVLTLATYADQWGKARSQRGIASAPIEQSRIAHHILPKIGAVCLGPMPLVELRPHHLRDWLHEMRKGKLAPRTVRHVYATLKQMLSEAVADELIPSNPCAVKRSDLPKKTDKDPAWRPSAIFTRGEVERIISDERIPEDRRTVYALLFFAGLRFGEGAALRWRHYDPTLDPLGRLQVAQSYSTRAKKEKSVKTERPREVPVHPVLAAVLAEWRLAGWARLMGRKPEPDDLIIPSRKGVHRRGNQGLFRFHQDLERLDKMRSRRLHDLRRTLISLAIADGARRDILRWVTHGPGSEVIDMYTTLPWSALCEAVACLKVQRLTGAQVIALPMRAAVGAEVGTNLAPLTRDEEKSRDSEGMGPRQVAGVQVLDAREVARHADPDAVHTRDLAGLHAPDLDRRGGSGCSVVPMVPIASDPVGDALAAALDRWQTSRSPVDLRRDLLALLVDLA
jgi:integrase